MRNLQKSLFILLTIASSVIYGNKQIDSLKSVIATNPDDSIKIETYRSIARLFVYKNTDSMFHYGNLSISYSDTLKHKGNIALVKHYYAKHLGFNGRNGEAFMYLDTVVRMFKDLNRRIHIASCYNDYGIIYWYQEDYDSALYYFKKSLAINLNERDSSQVALNLINLGNIYAQKGDYLEAVPYYKSAQKVFDDMNDEANLMTCLINIGNIHMLVNNYNEAELYFRKVYNIASKLGSKEDLAMCYDTFGQIIREREQNYDSALDYFYSAFKLADEIGDAYGKTSYLTSIAETYFDKENYSKAKQLYKETIHLAEAIDDKFIIANCYRELGHVYFIEESFDLANQYFEKAYNLSVEIESKHGVYNASYYLSRVYNLKNNTDEAYKYLEIAYNYKDSVSNDDQVKKLTQLEMQYEFDKIRSVQEIEKKKQKEIFDVKIQNQRTTAIILSGGVLILLVLLIIAFRNYLHKKRANIHLLQKNEIILQQKAEIEAQTDNLEEANYQISKQKEKLEFAHKHIKDSILYAKNLQNAIIGDERILKKSLNDYFIFWKPLDIVSGDFYWVKRINNSVVIAVADCTGHGVPGALISTIGISLLNEIFNRRELPTASKALQEIRDLFKSSLKQKEEEKLSKDGMEMGLCIIDLSDLTVQYSGAYHSLVLIQKDRGDNDIKRTIIKGDKQPVSFHPVETSFTNHLLKLKKGDALYMFTDGFADQFGGAKNKKFGKNNLIKLLESNYSKPMFEQSKILEEVYEEWTGIKYSQIDDILIMGIQI